MGERRGRVHFVDAVSQGRAVCGVRLDNGASVRLPLVFGDRKLWASFDGLGRCCRCAVVVAKEDRDG